MSEAKRPTRRRSRATRRSGLPKGAYRLPEGGIVLPAKRLKGSKISTQGVLREKPDTESIAQVLAWQIMDDAREEALNRTEPLDPVKNEAARKRVMKMLDDHDAKDGSERQLL